MSPLVRPDNPPRRGGRIGPLLIVAGVAALAVACGSSSSPGSSASTTGVPAQSGAQAAADTAAVAAGCPSNPHAALSKPHWSKAPAMSIDPAKTYTATVQTDVGTFVISLNATEAPVTVNNFVFLADQGFYNCVTFHRVVPGFMDQTGDPTGTGSGGPGYEFADELPKPASPQYPIGSVAMANAGPNTNGSQFFIVTGSEGEGLSPDYTLFGTVTTGMNVVNKINADGNADPQSNGVPPVVIHRMLKVTISTS